MILATRLIDTYMYMYRGSGRRPMQPDGAVERPSLSCPGREGSGGGPSGCRGRRETGPPLPVTYMCMVIITHTLYMYRGVGVAPCSQTVQRRDQVRHMSRKGGSGGGPSGCRGRRETGPPVTYMCIVITHALLLSPDLHTGCVWYWRSSAL